MGTPSARVKRPYSSNSARRAFALFADFLAEICVGIEPHESSLPTFSCMDESDGKESLSFLTNFHGAAE